MNHPHPAHCHAGALPPRDVACLMGSAADLRRSAGAGTPQRPLRGKNIALLAPSADLPAAEAATRAAQALGAQVVHVRPDTLPPMDAPAFAVTVGLLGRLYDAVVAEGVPAGLVRRLEAAADRPVLDDIAGDGHALRTLANAMSRLDGASDHHDWLLQALLVHAMA